MLVNNFNLNINKYNDHLIKHHTPSFRGNNYIAPEQKECPSIITPHYLMELITEDNDYRENLLQSVSLPKYCQSNIGSIMGPNETKKILTDLSKDEENFIASNENIKSGKFKANLHIHTVASDGYYTPEKLLNDAAEYADKVYEKTGKPFVIAITDHDTIRSHKPIIKEVYKNPKKYKNLKIILGMESTSFEDVKGQPIQFHMLIFNLNTNDKKFEKFLHNQQDKKQELAENVIDNINQTYKEKFNKDEDLLDYDEFSNYYRTMKNRGLSTHNYLRNYAMTKFVLKEVVTKTPEFDNYFEETNPNKDVNIELNKIKDYQYDLSHNNKSETPVSAISSLYTKELNIPKEEIQNTIFNQAKKDNNIINFVKEMNTNLYNHRNIKDNKNFYVNISEIYDALSNQPNAILGIAHPLSTVVDKTPDDTDFDLLADVFYKRSKSNKKKSENTKFIKDFYEKFKEKGKEKAKFSEAYYQSYSKSTDEKNHSEEVRDIINSQSLLKTGGYDSHRETIFSRY